MVSALVGASHQNCGGDVLKYPSFPNYICSKCRKELILEYHWYGNTLKETGRVIGEETWNL